MSTHTMSTDEADLRAAIEVDLHRVHQMSTRQRHSLYRQGIEYLALVDDDAPHLDGVAQRRYLPPHLHTREDYLVLAAARGRLRVVQMLAQHGADLSHGESRALKCAAWNGHEAVVRWLLQHHRPRELDMREARVIARRHPSVAAQLAQFAQSPFA